MSDIFEFISALHERRNRPSSGIIYCRRRGMCDEVSSFLRGKGINSRPYHRGIKCVLTQPFNIFRETWTIDRSSVLDKTLKDWEIGGTGEGGVDVVSFLRFEWTPFILKALGLCYYSIRDGYRQERCPVSGAFQMSRLFSLIEERYIIHYDLPKSFEGKSRFHAKLLLLMLSHTYLAYYQETGAF